MKTRGQSEDRSEWAGGSDKHEQWPQIFIYIATTPNSFFATLVKNGDKDENERNHLDKI